MIFTELTHLTGFSSEEATYLQLGSGEFSLQGLLIAGMVIGALGVLDDVTITQASTVLALRDANPSLGLRDLVARAMRVGRDHVSATVNTLVLAYVGAALPVLLIFSASDLSAGDVVNLELVAKEVVSHAGGLDRADRGGAAHDRAGGGAGAGGAAGAGRGGRGATRALERAGTGPAA